MIEAGLEFQSNALDKVLVAFVSLPDGLKPLYFTNDERIVGGRDNLIDDQKNFSAFVRRNKAGFFLKGTGVTYSVRIAEGKPIYCDCFFEIDSVIIREFLIRMAEAKPIFGFACAPAEREWRNKVTVKLGLNTIETWVGRDTSKYLPGLYWLTLIPEALANARGVELANLLNAALERSELPDNQYVLKFYDQPEDWLIHQSKLDSLCASTCGIFSAAKIRSLALAAKDYAELQSVLANWS